jgi:hypothetical protein
MSLDVADSIETVIVPRARDLGGFEVRANGRPIYFFSAKWSKTVFGEK